MYSIDVPASQQNLIEQIKSQSKQKIKETQKLKTRETKKITIKEGQNLDFIVKKLEEEGIVKSVEMKNFLQTSFVDNKLKPDGNRRNAIVSPVFAIGHRLHRATN